MTSKIRPLTAAGLLTLLLVLPACSGDDDSAAPEQSGSSTPTEGASSTEPTGAPTSQPAGDSTTPPAGRIDGCTLAAARIEAAVPGAEPDRSINPSPHELPLYPSCNWKGTDDDLLVLTKPPVAFRTETQDRMEYGSTTTTYTKLPEFGKDAYLRKTFSDKSVRFRSTVHAVSLTSSTLPADKLIALAEAVRTDLVNAS
jgi:hypothetical protein